MPDYTPSGVNPITIGDKTFTRGQRIPGHLFDDWEPQVLDRYRLAGMIRPLGDDEAAWDDDGPKPFTEADRDEDTPVPGALSTTAFVDVAEERPHAEGALSIPAVDSRTAEEVANIESEVDEPEDTAEDGVHAPGATTNIQVPLDEAPSWMDGPAQLGDTPNPNVDAPEHPNPPQRQADEDVTSLPWDIGAVTISDVKDYVGEHPAAARTALNAELGRGDDARSTLVNWLEQRAEDDDA